MTPPERDLAGGTCVLTGATSGIGCAAAVALAARGARLVLVARSPQRAAETTRVIHAAHPAAEVEVVEADLARLASVRAAGDAIAARHPRIDVLFNNAGVFLLQRSVSADGYETTFAVNHLAYFLLTERLLARLRATPGARIVSTASEAHRIGAPLDFDDLQSENRYRAFGVYGRSKLCNLLWTRELARRLDGSGVTANCFHPGGVATRLGQTDALWTRVIGRVLPLVLRKPEQGAATGVWLATAPELAGVSGRYFADEREKRPSQYALDDAAAARLWALSEALVARAS